MVSNNTSCNQWLSLAKTLLNVALVGMNRSLVARTSNSPPTLIGTGPPANGEYQQGLQPVALTG